MLKQKYAYTYRPSQKATRTIGDYIYFSVCSIVVSSLISVSLPKITNLIPTKIVYAANKPLVSPTPQPTPIPTPVDNRVVILAKFLATKNSPLADYAQYIVTQADKYAISWTEVVAISGIESNYGKKSPANTHNAWGLGGNRLFTFSSWEDGIDYASWLIGTKYRLAEDRAIKYSYCPNTDGCNSQWANIVTKNSEEILGL